MKSPVQEEFIGDHLWRCQEAIDGQKACESCEHGGKVRYCGQEVIACHSPDAKAKIPREQSSA